jgi:hypothetical protein
MIGIQLYASTGPWAWLNRGWVALVGRLLVLLGWTSMLFMASCQQDYKQHLEEERNSPPAYRVVTIEGCEYLRMEVTHGYAVLTHKGNCRNPIHCRQDTTAQPVSSASRLIE